MRRSRNHPVHASLQSNNLMVDNRLGAQTRVSRDKKADLRAPLSIVDNYRRDSVLVNKQQCHGPPGGAPGVGMRSENRRTFLKRVGQAGLATMAGGLLAGRSLQAAQDPATTLPVLQTRPDTGPIDSLLKSTVVHIRRSEVVDRQTIHPPLVREMLEESLKVLTDTLRPADAWNRLFKPEDVIGIKFNQVGAKEFNTTEAIAAQLVASLGDAGFSPARIMLIEVPAPLGASLGTRPEVTGWSGGEVAFDGGSEELAAVLQEVTAIINVPFLKTHNIAGITGCLKNLSHALIRHPGRYHDHGCAPYVGNIVALPQIRNKLRLNIVNAIRALYKGGPNVRPDGTWDHAGLIVSQDPVAADAVGLEIINDRRGRLGLASIGTGSGHVPHIRAAAELGLGTDDQDYIELREMAE